MATRDPFAAAAAPPPADRHFGKYRGLVVDVDDPHEQGRIRATVPDVLAGLDSGWALPAAPYAGPGVGVYTIPPVGAGVWIEFEAGDVSRPIWSGCWWADGDRPHDEQGRPATPAVKLVRSERGLTVALDDDGERISLSDADGANAVTIEVRAGTVTIRGAAKVVVEAPRIELAEDGSHPAVLGDELVRYLQQLAQAYATHVHAGQTAGGVPVSPAPPLAPLPAPSPSLLSTKVMAG